MEVEVEALVVGFLGGVAEDDDGAAAAPRLRSNVTWSRSARSAAGAERAGAATRASRKKARIERVCAIV